jgi:hypothetical protein
MLSIHYILVFLVVSFPLAFLPITYIHSSSPPFIIQLSLCLTNYALHHADVQISGCNDPRFLDLSTSYRTADGFTPPGESALGTHLIGYWVDPKVSLDDIG